MTQTAGAIDHAISAAVSRGDIPGAVAAVATREETIYHGAFGSASAEGAALEPDAIFRIYSMTKPVTSVAAMQLVEQGSLELDAPLATYVPHFANVRVLKGFASGSDEPLLETPATSVTVRHLLTHTSGFSYEFLNPLLAKYVADGHVPSLFDGGDGFLMAPLVFEPGQSWNYGISTDWLGRLIETVTGQSLDAVFQQQLFEPLGMLDTHFVVPDSKLGRVATSFVRLEGGSLVDERLVELPGQPLNTTDFFSGGGGLFSTAPDYLRFLRALLNDGELDGRRILTEESVGLMTQNHIGDAVAGEMPSLMPELIQPIPGFPDDRFGLGFLINGQPAPDGRPAKCLSWGGIRNTNFWIDPHNGLCATYMTQVIPCADLATFMSFVGFEQTVYRELV